MSKSIFLTGADGFIGSHLAQTLVRQGHKVKALALYNSFNLRGWLDDLPADILNEVEIVLGDVRDSSQMRHEIKGMDCVMHLAALIAIPFSYVAPQSYIDTNISGTLNILQAARDCNAEVIHTSTSEVYGTAQYIPIDEVHPLQGQSPYSASKIGADQLALSYFTSFDMPIKIVRPFNTYGPRQSMRAVIPTIICQLLNGASELKLGALSPTRDFNFIQDTVNGFSACMQSNAGIGEVVNIGSGFEISIKDVASVIAAELGREIQFVEDSERLRPDKSEVFRLYAANEKAKRLLGWEPEYGQLDGFKRGIMETIEWFEKPENMAKYQATGYVI